VRIGIDARYLSHGLVGGVHTYVTGFISALSELAEHQLYLYADTKQPFELDGLPDRVTVRYLRWNSPLTSLYHDFFLWRRMARDRVDVAHFPANYGFGPPAARTVITLHDALTVIPLLRILRGRGSRRSPRSLALACYLHTCTRLALRRAHMLFTDSLAAKQEIVKNNGFDPQRIHVVPPGLTPDVRPMEDPTLLSAVRQRYGLTQPFVLADALKNPAALVCAWRLLPRELREGRQLVFFSRRSDLLPVVRQAIASGEASLVVRPPREHLIALYSLAETFVFPSWIEGFGIPLLEAMACGAPVVASDRGAIPEVAGEAALLADAEDPAALAEHLARVLGDPSEAERLRERGFARAAQFSWHHSARRILEGYHATLN
jgi:glycosyltransferase involved in cell wall biosynthesis